MAEIILDKGHVARTLFLTRSRLVQSVPKAVSDIIKDFHISSDRPEVGLAILTPVFLFADLYDGKTNYYLYGYMWRVGRTMDDIEALVGVSRDGKSIEVARVTTCALEIEFRGRTWTMPKAYIDKVFPGFISIAV